MIIDQPEIKVTMCNWGFRKLITSSDKYCGELLYLIKGKVTETLSNSTKDLTLFVQSGKIKIEFRQHSSERSSNILGAGAVRGSATLIRGNNFYIPAGRIYRIIVIEDSEVFEFSSYSPDNELTTNYSISMEKQNDTDSNKTKEENN